MHPTLQTRTLLSGAAGHLVAMREAELPTEAISGPRASDRDTVGVTVAGAHEPYVRKLRHAHDHGHGPGRAVGPKLSKR